MKNIYTFSAIIGLAIISLVTMPVFADKEVEVLLLIPDEDTVASARFSDELEKGGARILEIYSPNIFRGYIPAELESMLKKKYGAKIYRERVGYMEDFAQYGDKGMLAAAKWNKHVQEEPDDAPLIINMTVRKSGHTGRYLKLCWNHVPDALAYRIQTSHNSDFSRISFNTVVKKNCYSITPMFWPDGVHYWRVAPSFKTVRKGVLSDGAFSQPSTFAVSKKSRPVGDKKLPAPVLPETGTVGRRLEWGPGSQPYYRLQVSEVNDFNMPLADVFTDTCSYRTSELQLKKGGNYYYRVMYSDGNNVSAWSAPSSFNYMPGSRQKAHKRK